MKKEKSPNKPKKATILPLAKVINKSFGLTRNIACVISILSILTTIILTSAIIDFKTGPYSLEKHTSQTQYLMKQIESTMYHKIVQMTGSRMKGAEEDMNAIVAQLNEELQQLFRIVKRENITDSSILSDLESKFIESEPYRAEIDDYVTKHRMTNANDVLVQNYLPLINEINTILDQIAKDCNQYAESQINQYLFVSIISITALIIMAIGSYLLSIKYAKRTSKRIVTPVTDIKEAMNELAQGNLQVSVHNSDISEINDLSLATTKTISSLTSYINNITTVLGQLENRDMTVSVDIDYIGDFAPIKNSLMEIIHYLNTLLVNIKDSANQVAAGAEQISNSSQSIAEGAQEQNNSITTLVNQVNDITTVVQNNATKAQDVSKISGESLEIVQKGNSHMEALLQAMSQITDQSNQISQIIEVINDIASQTNLLSLNASIEAARAGEQGKGFAVVADQIGKLANDCAKAAGNTTELINQSLDAIKNGSTLADDTASLLNDIVTSSSKTSDLVDSITDACTNQAEQLNQVLASIQQISVIVESNSAASEESSAASQEFLSQSETLKMLLEGFTL
ncbi:methyl-accepting chemotaxis protein [Anaerosporobacter faecicola]|uniref:methyl-accepting chemotaxis protein n=1 Tax=Anaerosporobacter faecicola TaxID=2718714 RepID=UPI00143A9DD3|nr:HAMP domain-containing methyl-accepting chemotaxis protein [Anaerosporobacter faecicola]